MDDVQARANAITAAAALCGAVGDGLPENVFFVADLFVVYTLEGSDAALAEYARRLALRPVETAPVVELREATPSVLEGILPELPKEPERPGEVFEAPAQERTAAFLRIQQGREQRARALVNQAKVAKALDHKKKLIEDAKESGLSDFTLTINGREQELGPYLQSLLGS